MNDFVSGFWTGVILMGVIKIAMAYLDDHIETEVRKRLKRVKR